MRTTPSNVATEFFLLSGKVMAESGSNLVLLGQTEINSAAVIFGNDNSDGTIISEEDHDLACNMPQFRSPENQRFQSCVNRECGCSEQLVPESLRLANFATHLPIG